MIEFKKGNILDEPVEALVNTVNCIGVMGRGIALQFKKTYPQNFKAYAAACKQGAVNPGQMFIVQINQLLNPKYIINFPTKRHWRGKSRIEDIDSGLHALVNEIQQRGIQSVAIPPLGCGLGGLEWSEVRPKIEAAFLALSDIRVVVFEPNAALSAKEMNPSTDVPKMTAGRAALVGLIDRYLRGLMDPVVTLLEVHKLMYFMQEAGQPLRLNYKKHIYGPYAENLRQVLHHIEGHWISGYADGGDKPDKELALVPGAVQDALAFLETSPDTIVNFEKVADLVDGFETPFGLELLATTHWVVTKENATSPEGTIRKVYAWNSRKKQFSEGQIHLAYQVLMGKGWITDHA